ncbi:hypothetical protein [Streptomyces californicus]|uniref:hypothetical protein n=1 Tax=Streptomyces californicus TaxID=67351 RepID=UPI0033C3579B
MPPPPPGPRVVISYAHLDGGALTDAWQGKACCVPTAHTPAPAGAAAAGADACGCKPGCTCCS